MIRLSDLTDSVEEDFTIMSLDKYMYPGILLNDKYSFIIKPFPPPQMVTVLAFTFLSLLFVMKPRL